MILSCAIHLHEKVHSPVADPDAGAVAPEVSDSQVLDLEGGDSSDPEKDRRRASRQVLFALFKLGDDIEEY